MICVIGQGARFRFRSDNLCISINVWFAFFLAAAAALSAVAGLARSGLKRSERTWEGHLSFHCEPEPLS